MIENVLERLFPVSGQPLTYKGFLNGAHFATQWTVYTGPSLSLGAEYGTLHEFVFYLELDPTAIGQGGSKIQQRTRLLCNDALAPVLYKSHAMGTTLGLRFTGDTVQVDMPDGSKQSVPAESSQFLIEANMVGQQALMLALAHARGQLGAEAKFTCFVVNGLVATPYRTVPAPDLATDHGYCLRSSHEEELLLRSDGLLELARTPSQAIEMRIEEPALPLPDWHAQAQQPVDRPTYHPPANARFRLEDVTIPGPVTPLGGTLTIPEGAGPFPAVLFLSGSGSHDRHGIAGEVDIGSHELVDHLANQGFVGLRYDTRGAGGTLSGKDALDHGLVAIIDDARAALAYLRQQPQVDPKRVFLIGHSQGGSVALALGAGDDSFAGIVTMAAMGRGIDELLSDQTAQYGKNLGLSEEQVQSQLQRLRDYIALVMSDRPWVPSEVPDHLFTGKRNRRWIREHMEHKPTDLMKSVRAPLLICQGEKDFQVSPERDALRLVQAAQTAGLAMTYEFLPRLDHLFKPVIGAESRIEQYFDRDRHVDSRFLARITAWLQSIPQSTPSKPA